MPHAVVGWWYTAREGKETMAYRFCEAVVIRGSYWEPEEGCEELALEDSDYCEAHRHYDDEPDPDAGRDDY